MPDIEAEEPTQSMLQYLAGLTDPVPGQEWSRWQPSSGQRCLHTALCTSWEVRRGLGQSLGLQFLFLWVFPRLGTVGLSPVT